ncbi:ferritin-like domain-containing protein [Erythrobacter sp. W53]|uniref:ferritin-like domain-containing protein n=1 Tax=Erythrobacter sp. W53 TaxID=3425947 RepID=UPI003D766A2A
MSAVQGSLGAAIRGALLTGDAKGKVFATRKLVRDWRQGRLSADCPKDSWPEMPPRPAWPEALVVSTPGQMPKRSKGTSEKGRIALWHALAHIEFVAIDLALDIVGRFAAQMVADLGADAAREFIDDFLSVAADEAMHFALLDRKLATLGSYYTALPAHDGLWQAAEDTAHDAAARLAIVPMVLEARGLDVTPATLNRVRAQGDENGAKILQRILDDEIRHVGFGAKHFERISTVKGLESAILWQNLVKTHFSGRLKGPFNDSARSAAGLPRDFYLGIAS